jgi:hypothetical protein
MAKIIIIYDLNAKMEMVVIILALLLVIIPAARCIVKIMMIIGYAQPHNRRKRSLDQISLDIFT